MQERGFALRGTFLIDGDGVVRTVHGVAEPRDPDGYRKALAELA